MEAEAVEFQDWQVVSKSDGTALVVDSSSALSASIVLDSAPTKFDEAESEGMIRSDYFSIDNRCRYAKTVAQGDVSEEGSVSCDNPSWIDPGVVEDQYGSKIFAEFLSDSVSDRSEEHKIGDSDASKELGLAAMEGGNKISGGLRPDSERKAVDLNLIYDLGVMEKSESVAGIEELGVIGRWDKNSDKGLSDGEIADGDCTKTLGVSNDLDGGSEVQGRECGTKEPNLAVAEVKDDMKSGGDGEKMRILWWKVPFEVLKYCVYRVSPLWSVSVAAAFVGFIFLGRRLYKMKRKSPGLHLKLTLDDKKVSQFRSHTARLNEAFSVVRRVSVTRPSLPIAGVSPWPVVSLR